MAKVHDRNYHKKRAIIGGAVAATGVLTPVGVAYGGYHLYKMGDHPKAVSAPPRPGVHPGETHTNFHKSANAHTM